MRSPSEQCRCRPPIVGPLGLVHRVDTCPSCLEGALKWFGYQYELFPEEGESVSVSALTESAYFGKSASIVESVSDGLPF